MTIAFQFQYIDAKTNDPIGGLPVNVTFKWPGNYLGYGAGQKSFSATTDGSGTISFDESDLIGFTTGGTDTVILSTPQTPSDTPVSESTSYTVNGAVQTTYYNVGYRPTKNTYNAGSEWDNKTYSQQILVQPYQNTSTKNLSTGQTGGTSGSGQYESGGIAIAQSWQNFISNLSSGFSKAGATAQTDIEIIAIVGALVAVIIIIVLLVFMKARAGPMVSI